MKIRPVLAIILCGALAFGAQATPINFSQIGDTQSGRQPNASTAAQPSTRMEEPVEARLTVESLDHPEFVRLADGRLIPYGPGVICSDMCEESVVTPPGLSRRWFIVLPLAGAAIAGVILATSDHSRVPRTAVDGNTQPPGTDPTPTPTPVCTGGDCSNPPTEPVPEPGTIALLGAGLAVLSRRRLREFVQRKQK